MTRDDRWALGSAIVCVSIFATVSSLVLPVLVLNLEARGESSVLIGIFGAMLGLTAMLGTPFTPALVRHIGSGKALCILLLVVAVANLLYKIFEHSLLAWFMIYTASMTAVGLIFVIAETIITTLAPATRRGLILGFYATGFSFGFAAGPVILQLIGVEGWAPFIIAAVLATAAAALVGAANIKKSVIPALAGAGFWRMLVQGPLPFACAFSLGAAETSVYDLLPIYARKIGFEVSEAIFILVAFSVGTLCLQPIVGAFADKFDSRRMLATAACAGVVGAMALPMLLDGASMEWRAEQVFRFVCLGIWGGLFMAIYPLGLAQAVRIFPKNRLASANAMFGFSYGGGALCGPILTGAAMDISPHGIAAALALFALLPLLALWHARLRGNGNG